MKMSPNRFKRYTKTKVRHPRKELDERKKRISGLTLVQDMGQNSREPDKKQTTRATTGFTRAVREFGEQRRLFDTEAYASVVSKVKTRPKITKGRLTVPNQGLFARGKISKPACRGRQAKAQDCELHEIIRQAQNNPRGQEYQLQKQRQRDCSPEADDPDPVPSPGQSSGSFEGLSPTHDDRFSPDFTSTKRKEERRSFLRNARSVSAEAPASTIVRDASPPSNANRTLSPSMKDMFSLSAKHKLSPDSRDDDASVREMEREENVMDGMTKWITQMRAALNFTELGYLQGARKYLKDLHKETLRRELETAALAQMAIASKPTTQKPSDLLQSTIEQNARQRPQGVDVHFSEYTNQLRTNHIEFKMTGASNQTVTQEKLRNEFEEQNHVQEHSSGIEVRQTTNVDDSYKPQEGNPFSSHENDIFPQLQPHGSISEAKYEVIEVLDSSDESFNYSPNVSEITEFPISFDVGKEFNDKKDEQKRNSCRLREGRERVLDFQAAEERERLQRKKEMESRSKFSVYADKLRSGDQFRGRSCNRPGHREVESPGRSSKSLERSYQPIWGQRLVNGPGQLRERTREGLRKFGEENRDWYTKDEMRRKEGHHRPMDGESSNYRETRRMLEERNDQDYDLRSPLGLPCWLLEKTPERVFRPQKMFN